MPGNTISNIAPMVEKTATRMMLATPFPTLVHNIPARKIKNPAKSGPVNVQRRYNPLDAVLDPLGPSSIDPEAQVISVTDIQADIQYYGGYAWVDEQALIHNQEDVLVNVSERLAEQMRKSEDQLTANVLASTASLINCTQGNNGDSPTELTADDISRVTRTLLGNSAHTIEDVIGGENKFSTSPIRRAFFGLCSTDLTADMDSIPQFVNTANYPTQGRTIYSEYGNLRGVRFLVSELGISTPNASSNGNTVYDIYIPGMDAYSVIRQDGLTSKAIYQPAYDPFRRRASLAWLMGYAAVITNDLWVQKLRCTLSVS